MYAKCSTGCKTKETAMYIGDFELIWIDDEYKNISYIKD